MWLTRPHNPELEGIPIIYGIDLVDHHPISDCLRLWCCFSALQCLGKTHKASGVNFSPDEDHGGIIPNNLLSPGEHRAGPLPSARAWGG